MNKKVCAKNYSEAAVRQAQIQGEDQGDWSPLKLSI